MYFYYDQIEIKAGDKIRWFANNEIATVYDWGDDQIAEREGIKYVIGTNNMADEVFAFEKVEENKSEG